MHEIPANSTSKADTIIKLYQYQACPFCERVRQKFAQLNVPYQKIEVDPANKPAAVLSVGNTVPVIDDNGMIMNESGAIIKYLEKKFGGSLTLRSNNA